MSPWFIWFQNLYITHKYSLYDFYLASTGRFLDKNLRLSNSVQDFPLDNTIPCDSYPRNYRASDSPNSAWRISWSLIQPLTIGHQELYQKLNEITGCSGVIQERQLSSDHANVQKINAKFLIQDIIPGMEPLWTKPTKCRPNFNKSDSTITKYLW